MFSGFKRSAINALVAVCAVGFLSSCSSTTDFADEMIKTNQSFALAATKVQPFENPFLKAQKELLERQRAATKKKTKTTKSTQTKQAAKRKKAVAKELVDREKKRLATFDKMTAALNDQQKALLKNQRDALSGKVTTAEKALAKLTPKPKVRRGGGKGSKYNALIARYARANGVPLKLAHAVVRVESSYRANARGGAGEIGLMQIKHSTARLMGYRGSKRGLYNPETNIKYGMKYLGKAHKLAGGSTCGTILRYNAGHGAKRMNPVSRRYCRRVARII